MRKHVQKTMKLVIPAAAFMGFFAQISFGAIDPGTAFWSFQATPAGTGAGNAFVQSVTVESFVGTPTFAFAGTLIRPGQNPASFSGGANFTLDSITYAGDGTTGSVGNVAGWDSESSINSFSVNLATTGFEKFAVRLDYRSTASGGLTAFTNFQYSLDGTTFFSLGSPAGLTANSTFLGWSQNLAATTAIDNKPSVTLRWTLPAIPDETSFRLDNLLITSSPIPEPMAVVAGLLGASSLLRRRHSSQF